MTNTVARRQGFTLVELLVVIAIIAIIAGLVVPVLLQGRGEAYKIQCTNNLKQIYGSALSYSNKKYAFPYAKNTDGFAHDSLNLLLRSRYGRNLPPEVFKCPSGDAVLAEIDEEDKFFLDAETLDYAWAAGRVKNSGKPEILASDKYIQDYEDEDGVHSGHDLSMIILKSDGAVSEMDASDLPEDTMLPEGLTR